MSDAILGPRKRGNKWIYLSEFVDPETENSLFKYIHEGDTFYCKLNYEYRFLSVFLECGSYHFSWAETEVMVVCRIFCKLDSPVIPHIINPYP